MRTRVLFVVFAVAVVAMLVGGSLYFSFLAGRYAPTPRDMTAQRIDMVKAVTGIVTATTGIATAAGLIFTLAFTAMTLRVNQNTLRLNQETLELNRKGQINERFIKALAQLEPAPAAAGTDNLATRIGAVYALEQIAIDDPASYHWPVYAMLATYVRRHSPAAWPAPAHLPGPDIQAIVTVIGQRRNRAARETGRRIDLRSADLRGIDFTNGDYTGPAIQVGTGVDLRGADLSTARLTGANFSGADFGGANVANARFLQTRLAYADVTGILNLTQNQKDVAVADVTTIGW